MRTIRSSQAGGSHAGLACTGRAQDHRAGSAPGRPRRRRLGCTDDATSPDAIGARAKRPPPARIASRTAKRRWRRRIGQRRQRSICGGGAGARGADRTSGPVGPIAPVLTRETAAPARGQAKPSREPRSRGRGGKPPPEFPAHARVANPRALPGPTGRSPPPCPRTTSSPRSDRPDRFVPAAGQEGGVRRAPGSANLPRPEGCSPRGRSSRDSRARPRHAGNHTDGCRPSRPGAVPGATCAPANLPCDGSAGWSHRLDAARSPRPIGRAQRGRKSRQVLIRYIGIRTRGFVQASGSRRG